MSTFLADLRSLGEVLLAALVLGAGLPAVFALGVRWWSVAERPGPDGSVRHNFAAWTGAVICLAVVLAVVVAGVLFVAKAFLADRFGIHILGQA
ncbi:hypothetical protein [Nocardia sp. NPDC024068]|uniref:hypothetical protein n=1 Tax=Nocardia sp. NPDC024068 TaxID=3157197 RepID=UPI0033C07FBE